MTCENRRKLNKVAKDLVRISSSYNPLHVDDLDLGLNGGILKLSVDILLGITTRKEALEELVQDSFDFGYNVDRSELSELLDGQIDSLKRDFPEGGDSMVTKLEEILDEGPDSVYQLLYNNDYTMSSEDL